MRSMSTVGAGLGAHRCRAAQPCEQSQTRAIYSRFRASSFRRAQSEYVCSETKTSRPRDASIFVVEEFLDLGAIEVQNSKTVEHSLGKIRIVRRPMFMPRDVRACL